MSEVFDRVDNLNKTNNEPKENQVDKFSQTTKLLDKELNDKKENILKVLEEGNLKEIFENLLSSEDGELCIMSLLECENNEEKIKKVIFENLPEGYAYNVSTNEVVKTEKKNANDYSGATTMDQKTEQAGQDKIVRDQKTEQADQKTEQADQKTEQAGQDKIVRDQKTEQADKNKTETEEQNKKTEIIGNARIAHAKRDELRLKYDGLQQKTDKGSDLYNKVENNLKNSGVLNQLEEIGKSINDSNFVENYISLQATLQELKSNPTIYEPSDISSFDKIVKNLENSCNIPDTNLNSFSKDNIGNTRKEMFNADVGNNNLISARDSNKESHSAEYGELFKDTDMMDTIKKYGKFFPEGAKQYLKKYEEYYKSGKALEYENSDEGKKLKETLLNVKQSVDNYTENFIEEMCLMSHIKGMTMCVGEDFNINKAREINNENGVLTIEGHINGVDFGLRHDTNNPDSLLQTSSKFSASPDKGSFTIRSKPEFTDNADSNFILPSQTEVFNLVTQRVKTAMNEGGILDNAGNRDEFKNALENELQNDIIGKIDDSYKNTEYTHHYIADKVRSEQIVDNAVGLIKSIDPSETNLPGEISITSNPKLFNFIKILSFNLENSTAEEKNKLDESITQIKEIIRENKNNNGDDTGEISSIPIAAGSIAADYLKAEKRNSSGDKETKDSQRNLISELFSQYSEHSQDARYAKNIGEGIPPKMIINDLYKDLFDSTSDVSQASKYKNDEDVSHNAYDNMMANRPNDSSDSDTSDMA